LENRTSESQEIEKLDLQKYGLSHLEGRNLLDLPDDEMDALLEALGNDDISLNIPMPSTPSNIQRLLNSAECRRCGRCCIANPLNPNSPGVEVFESELRQIAALLQEPYESWVQRTKMGKVALHPVRKDLSLTRWLPLPCPFYDEEGKGCRVYSARPIVCSIHPVIFTGDDAAISVKANCEYGRDIIKNGLMAAQAAAPDMVIEL